MIYLIIAVLILGYIILGIVLSEKAERIEKIEEVLNINTKPIIFKNSTEDYITQLFNDIIQKNRDIFKIKEEILLMQKFLNIEKVTEPSTPEKIYFRKVKREKK